MENEHACSLAPGDAAQYTRASAAQAPNARRLVAIALNASAALIGHLGHVSLDRRLAAPVVAGALLGTRLSAGASAPRTGQTGRLRLPFLLEARRRPPRASPATAPLLSSFVIQFTMAQIDDCDP